MKGFTIQNSIDLLEKAVESGSGGTTAASVTYDNTTSHLTADDVQEAIDELDSIIDALPEVGTISTTEKIVGKWLDGRDICQKAFEIASDITFTADTWTDLTGCSNDGMDFVLSTFVLQYDSGEFAGGMPVEGYKGSGSVISALSLRSATTIKEGSVVIVTYVKPVPTNTRKKK